MSMFLELLKGHHIQSCVFRGFQTNLRSHSIFVGLFPARSTDAPVVSGLQARELKGRHRCGEIIPLSLAVPKKGFRHHAANAVLPLI